MSRAGVLLRWGLGAAVWLAPWPLTAVDGGQAGLPPLRVDCDGAELFGGSPLERAGWCTVRDSRFVDTRTLAEAALREDAGSVRAHLLLGLVQHLGEGNLPLALHHQLSAEAHYTVGRPPRPAAGSGDWFLLRIILLELVSLHGEMNLHAAQIRYVDLATDRLGEHHEALKCWPLIKLRRYEEAREVALAAASLEGPQYQEQREDGLTALCAIESEQQHREAAARTCLDAARSHLRPGQRAGGVSLVNAGVAAMEMLRAHEAERLILEATARQVEGTINPWGLLSQLYLRQGRLPEAVGALRQMHGYRRARPPHLDQQDQAESELSVAAALLVAGLTEDARRISARVVERPQRLGSSSAAAEQHLAGILIMDRVVLLDAARRAEEEASGLPWRARWASRVQAWGWRLTAWSRGRAAAALMAHEPLLLATLRPDCPGAVELPMWLKGELASVVGAGVLRHAVTQARAVETLPPELSGGYFDALEAEARLQGGDGSGAQAAALRALGSLPPWEKLLRARLHAVVADAARDAGDLPAELDHLTLALAIDPGVIRRTDVTIPVRVLPQDGQAATLAAARRLAASPRFRVGQAGFDLQLGLTEVTLTAPDGSRLSGAEVPEGPGDEEAAAARILRTVHRDLLAPQMDMTQADVRSLDGSLGGGPAAADHVRSVLEQLTR